MTPSATTGGTSPIEPSSMPGAWTPAGAPVLVARQPILDRDRALHGYELLYRDADPEHARVGDGDGDGDRATAHVVITAFLDIGLTQLAEYGSIYINVTRDFLLSGAALALPRQRVVLELLEDMPVDAELVAAASELVRLGYRLALDDFVYAPRWEPLIALAEVVKLDVRALGMARTREHIALLERHDVTLLAEKVETEAEHQALHAMGVELFQGYFFAKPRLVQGARLPENTVATLRLLAVLQDPSTDLDQVTELVTQDPALSYRLMRFINSAAVALPIQVASVHRAVVCIGLDAVKRWVTLSAVMTIGRRHEALILLALVRARMMEELCRLSPECEPGVGFTLGLFSTLDAFLDHPLVDVLDSLALADELKSALLHGQGPYGALLKAVRGYERGDWAIACAHARNVSPATLGECYARAVTWARSAVAATT